MMSDQNTRNIHFSNKHVISLKIILPWYAIYITAELNWRKSCMDYLCIKEDHLCQFGGFVFIPKATGNQEILVQESNMSRIK